jgi:sugar porter (SP) family MFS transporter
MAIGGVWVSYWLDFGMSYTDSTAQWRFPLAFPAVFALAMSGVAFFMPESPRWLVLKKRDEEAKQVLAALAGADVPNDDESVVALYTSIRRAIDYEDQVGGEFSYRELFTGGELQNFRRICLCFGIQLMEEMCGINLITYYMSNVFLQIGTSYFMALLLSGINSTTYFISSFVPIWLIDRFGRKTLLIYGSVGMMCMMIMLTVSLSFGTENFTAGVFAILSIFLFNIFYSTGGWMATPFLYPSEISTLRIRSKGSAISVLSKWMFNFLVVMISPVAMANIGWKTYIIFIVLNFVFIFVIYFFYPETKGLALEQVDKIFEGGDSITRGAMHRRRLDGEDIVRDLQEKQDQEHAGHVEDITKPVHV